MPEMRALAVARWDITSPEACTRVVNCARDNNLNAIFLQVRGRGDAFYKSAYEPRAQELAGQSPDFDPLAQFLDEGHAAGIQIHAWINANLTWGSMTPPVSPEHIINKHPDWLMRTKENKFTMLFGRDVEGAYTCPSNEVWRHMYVDIYLDVVRNYDVDGVHFDFIRYPSPRFCYCDRCLSKFTERMKDAGKSLPESTDRLAYPNAFGAEWDDYRREQITAMVYSVYDAVKQAKPEVVVSASVFPNLADARDARYQDWTRWTKEGKMDLICLMSYSPSTARVARQVKEAVENSSGVPVCVNVGASYVGVDSCVLKIRKSRQLGVAGFNLFAYTGPNGEPKEDYFAQVKEKAYPAAEFLPLVGKSN